MLIIICILYHTDWSVCSYKAIILLYNVLYWGKIIQKVVTIPNDSHPASESWPVLVCQVPVADHQRGAGWGNAIWWLNYLLFYTCFINKQVCELLTMSLSPTEAFVLKRYINKFSQNLIVPKKYITAKAERQT